VSVSFPRDDFAEVAPLATELGMTTSAFIRRAALERVAESARRTWHTPEFRRFDLMCSTSQGHGIQMAIPVGLMGEGGGIEVPTPVGPTGQPFSIGAMRVASRSSGQIVMIELEPEHDTVMAESG
jgi:hypothetical protein